MLQQLQLRSAKWPIRSVLHGYGIPLVGLLLATGISILIRPYLGAHSAVTIVFLVAVLASAWFGGYGPGLVACLLGLFVVPYAFVPSFHPLKVDMIRAALVLLASLVISRTADIQENNARALRKAHEELMEAHRSLDARVKERTAELEESNNELKRLNTALNEFAYSASHDLQQPLRNIAMFGQMLQRKYGGKLDSDADFYVQTITSSARQMSALLSDLLAYSRSINLSARDAEVIDSNAVLRDALANLRQQITESGAEVAADNLPQARMHRFHLLELFQNLISNAIKYRSEDPPKIRIEMFTQPAVGIAISDNGIGIAPEYAAQVFGLFKRLHTVNEYEGTGVGLAICEAIVERYGGRIWVEQNAPRGSIFRFTVPFADSGADSKAESSK